MKRIWMRALMLILVGLCVGICPLRSRRKAYGEGQMYGIQCGHRYDMLVIAQ